MKLYSIYMRITVTSFTHSVYTTAIAAMLSI